MILIGYLGLCAVVGIIGEKKQIGFAGAFVLSIVLSPLVGLIIAIASKDKEK